jgi:hypothetical protein
MPEVAYFQESCSFLIFFYFFITFYVGSGSKSGSGTGTRAESVLHSGSGSGSVKAKSYGSCGVPVPVLAPQHCIYCNGSHTNSVSPILEGSVPPPGLDIGSSSL